MAPLRNISCLVVEDEALVAMSLCDIIEDLGGRVFGHATRLETGIEIARTAAIDLAFLDINLGGLRSFPIADILKARAIPFIFTSGYGGDAIDGGYAAPLVGKPYDERMIATGAQRALASTLGKM